VIQFADTPVGCSTYLPLHNQAFTSSFQVCAHESLYFFSLAFRTRRWSHHGLREYMRPQIAAGGFLHNCCTPPMGDGNSRRPLCRLCRRSKSCFIHSVEHSAYSPYLVDCRYLEAGARWRTHPERKFYFPAPCTIGTHEFIRFMFSSSSAGMSHPSAPKPVLAKTGPASAR